MTELARSLLFCRHRPDNNILTESLLSCADQRQQEFHELILSQMRTHRITAQTIIQPVPQATHTLTEVLGRGFYGFAGSMAQKLLGVEDNHPWGVQSRSDITDFHIDLHERVIYAPDKGTQPFYLMGFLHERAHVLTAQALAPLQVLSNPELRAYAEGIALGVERYANNTYADNVSFQNKYVCTHSAENSTHYLIEAYRMLYSSSEPLPQEFSEVLIALRKKHEVSSALLPCYAVGHALFALKELEHGPGIYAEALKNPRIVLE